MAAPSIADIRTALAAAIDNTTITVAQVSRQLRAFPYDPGGVLPMPCALVGGGDVEYDQSFGRGHDMIEFRVVCMCDGDARSVDLLFDAMQRGSGATSVKTAIEADRTLGGVVSTLHVASSRRIVAHDNGGLEVAAVEFPVTVYCVGV
jgi:hypothetical protein